MRYLNCGELVGAVFSNDPERNSTIEIQPQYAFSLCRLIKQPSDWTSQWEPSQETLFQMYGSGIIILHMLYCQP